MKRLVLVLLCLLAGPLPYIGTEPTQGVKPELHVAIHQGWLGGNRTSAFAVNQTIVWTQPRQERWTRYDAGNWTFFLGWRILWLSSAESSIPHVVNVTVTVSKLDDALSAIEWEVSAQDDQMGILFVESGSLTYANQSARVSRFLAFFTPAYPVCGGCWPDLWDILLFLSPWCLLALVLFSLGEAVSYLWRRQRPAVSSPGASPEG